MGTRPICCPRCGSKRVEASREGKSPCRCLECRSRFGDEEESMDYASRLVKFSMEIKNLSGTRLDLRLSRTEERFSFLVKNGEGKGVEEEVDENFWNEFSHSLFLSWHFHKWNESYFDTQASDGLVWDAEASFERKHTISVHGFNSRPVYWNDLMESLSSILEDCGITLTLSPSFNLEGSIDR